MKKVGILAETLTERINIEQYVLTLNPLMV